MKLRLTMKIGDLVRWTPEAWGTPLEDRPIYVVVHEPYRTSTRVSSGILVDIMLPGDPDTLSTNPNTLEVISENR
jgi:hypothetical protein